VITPTLNTRKPVVKLKVSDFRTFPIWEFAIDEEGENGQDEKWVRPVQCSVLPLGAYSLLVATDFTMSSGRRLTGCMSVSSAHGKIEISPGAVLGRVGYKTLPTVSRALAVRRQYDWSISGRDALIRALGVPENEIFPLRYTLRVVIRSEKKLRTGVIR